MKFLNYLFFIKSYFFKKYPIELTYFVTSNCNFRCKHCFNWQNIEREKKKKKNNELSLEEIRKFTKKTPPLLRLLISGGEPFLRKDLPEICQIFHNNTKVLHISIPTNASLPELIEKKTIEILKKCPNSFINISLSLDQLGKKRDEFVKFKGSFKKFQETYNKLIKVKKRFKNLGIGVITTLNINNQTDIKNIYDYSKQLKVDNFGFNVVRGSPKFPKIKNVDLKYFKNFTKYMINDSKSEFGKMNFPFFKIFLAKKNLQYELYYKIRAQNKYLIPCYSGRIRGVINETGDVYPCENYMYAKPNLKFGNLREYNYNFNKLWISIRSKKIKRMIKDTKCFCTHECDLTTNILFNLRLFPQLIIRFLKILKS